MKLSAFVQAVRANGMRNILLRRLFKMKLLSYEEIGRLVERFGNQARLDGFIFSTDNRLLPVPFKGEIVLGEYEHDELQLIMKYLPRDEPVIELGASIGIVACKVNRHLLAPEKHVVVEANPELMSILQKNRDLNRCQFEIINKAISYSGSTITFFVDESSLCGNVLYKSGPAIEIPATTLQAVAEQAGFHHFNLISDIEGSEVDLVQHKIDFLREHVGLILMEIHAETPHGEAGADRVLELLQQNSFEMIDSIPKFGGLNCCYKNKLL